MRKVSIYGDDVEILIDLEKYSIWDEYKEKWLANWDKELGEEDITYNS